MKSGPHQAVLGDVLKAWRESKGLNMRDAAKVMHVSYSTLSRIESGKTTPDAKNLVAILNWLMGSNGRSETN